MKNHPRLTDNLSTNLLTKLLTFFPQNSYLQGIEKW
jgi:hypothetical protein